MPLRLRGPDLERFLELIPDAIIAVDSTGKIVLANRLAEELFGYEHQALLDCQVEDLVPQRDRDAHGGHRDKYFGNPRTRPMGLGLELWGRRRDGTEFPADISLTTFGVGEDRMASAAIRDVTQRVAAERERRELEDQARESRLQQTRRMESIGELAGGIAHDFNNLLAVVLNNAELALRDQGIGEQTREELKEIVGVSERGAKLTRQLLIFSRRQHTPKEPVDLNEVITEIERLLVRTLGEHIEFEVDLEPGLPRILADSSQIEQLLMNLVINARDAMPSGGRLSIRTRRILLDESHAAERPDTEPGEHVELVVADTGTGMPPEVKARAFEPFFTTKPKAQGTGLGLATVYGIVKQSNGHVGIYSEPGEGSVFRISLPTVAGSGEAPQAALAHEAGGEGLIVVIEDADDVRRTVVRILEPAGYTVVSFEAPIEAIGYCLQKEHPIDLVLTDVVMPQMLGTEVAERLKRVRPEIPVLYMSGFTDAAPALDDVAALIEKPFTADELLLRIREVLGRESA